MTTTKKRTRTRKKPETAGERFRRSVLATYELDEAELGLLDQAVELMEALAKINAAVRALDSPTTPGSRGQPVEHPALAAQRDHSTTLARVIEAMRLPAPGSAPDAEGESITTIAARRAAQARWAKERRNDGA